ncbi:hypothetical protein HELRODRAFT_88238 [Helobdella robusta]|uniref:Uncharacterized protein n=1 Tax=Helobdella robusta TaxID=6412 RepID=T1G704_HELRO|nr:hypothetical protein HELRODRAFT_88238 [Helobdella robusta]ESN93763.1 hypothetical protein HELRODRAFT_88238 [Helobdella robusta]
MEITYVYTRLRSNFGRHYKFKDSEDKILCDIKPDPEISQSFIDRDPVDRGVQCTVEQSVQEVNTERRKMETKSVNHVEGGWPRDVHYYDPDQVARFRKKIEKDDVYIETVKKLAETMERYIRQNNSLDIYEDYFGGAESILDLNKPTLKIINLFNDQNEIKRPVSSLSWFTDGPKKVAVSYADPECQDHFFVSNFYNCYIWDVESPHNAEMTLRPQSQVACLEYNPKDPHTIVGGQYNGQVVLWDCRGKGTPYESSDALKGHKDVVRSLVWIQSKTGCELFSASLDGQVLWWDTRKLTEYTEVMYLDPTRKQEATKSIGAQCLEFESTIPTKFMAGCVEGSILICNRKAKSAVEKVSTVYTGVQKSPVYSLQRNPFFLKNFLSCSAYQIRFWSEDWKESSIWCSREFTSHATFSCWSPTRPSVLYTAMANGMISCWNVLLNQKEPVFKMPISKQALRCMKMFENGKFLVVAGDDGMTTLLRASDDLVVAEKNEKKELGEFFDRETKREKNLEAMRREKRKVKSQSPKESSVSRRNS